MKVKVKCCLAGHDGNWGLVEIPTKHLPSRNFSNWRLEWRLTIEDYIQQETVRRLSLNARPEDIPIIWKSGHYLQITNGVTALSFILSDEESDANTLRVEELYADLPSEPYG